MKHETLDAADQIVFELKADRVLDLAGDLIFQLVELQPKIEEIYADPHISPEHKDEAFQYLCFLKFGLRFEKPS